METDSADTWTNILHTGYQDSIDKQQETLKPTCWEFWKMAEKVH